MLPLIAVLGLVAGSGTAVRIGELGEVELKLAMEITETFVAELRAHTKTEVVFDDPTWECDAPDRCLAEIRARTRMEEIVLLRVLGGPTRIQIEAERIGSKKAAVWIPHEREGWSPQLRVLAESLFDPGAPPAPLTTSSPAPPPAPEARSFLLPAVLIGAGVAGVVAGAVFGAQSKSAAADQETMLLAGDRRVELADRQQAMGIAADVSFGLAATAGIAAVVSLLVE